ncbi:PTS hybrid protein/phosphocarrier protein [Actinacidiphila yanglinensis]|uniref:Phosphocarrier protein HPr n=1 Tax=Actinacidiphila yanglinensis TaxID=310779 RepID=A0A1H6CVN4_9ACTN|nr:HPr family phosphocarrier protein [Actinacidiphila yanglinensis]SEG76753.1 PTS hybrid protein/phosphocarrier protein [Actinacidiphila yanglinensis]
MSASSETPVGTAGEIVEIPVVLPAHLHARPAGRIAQAAARFDSTLLLQYGERSANPRGVLAVMALGATAGRTVTVRAQGPDATEAAAALAEILATAE